MKVLDPLDVIREGVWHFTDFEGAKGILADSRIRQSSRSKNRRDNFARHLGAVALFDLGQITNPAIEPLNLELQLSNCRGFLGGLTGHAFGLSVSISILPSVFGPQLPGIPIAEPVVDEDGMSYLPNLIPYFERWHFGDVDLGLIDRIYLWRVLPEYPTSTGWEWVDSFDTLAAAVQQALAS
jgi:hypothetical protein